MRSFFLLTGFLNIELTSADPEGLLQSIINAGIAVHEIQRISDLTMRLTLLRQDYPHLTQICQKQGAKEEVLSRFGLYWSGIHAIRRPLLLLGLIFIFCFCLFLPTRILFVRVTGNTWIPAKKILSAAQESGISFGASRRAVRSEKVKNTLLSSLPELEWVGVNTTGCVAEVSVRERSEAEKTKSRRSVSHITATRDGVLLSMTVTSGNPICAPGQQVKQGQLLVSGYTDCGIYIQATSADAEIIAQTNRYLEVITPSSAYFRQKETGRKRKYSLLVGKKRINLWKCSGIPDSSCGRIYEEKYATLPGGFQLPLALCVEEFTFYDMTRSPTEDGSRLSSFARQYLAQQMIAGTILDQEEYLSIKNGVICLEGNYTCQEMIGRVQHEQIGDEHGKIH